MGTSLAAILVNMKMSNASCLLLLVLGVLVAAAAAHPRQHDPCKYDDMRGWKWAAETGEEIDEEAMKKLPQAYVQYGWRHYRSGKCSYKGWEQHCPDYYHKKHGGHHYDEKYWDHYFPERKCLGAHCTSNSTCCSNNCVDGLCCAATKVGIDASCNSNTDCCSGQCTGTGGKCCIPPGSFIKCSAASKCCGAADTVTCNGYNKCCLNNGQTCATSNSWENVKKGNWKCCSGKCDYNTLECVS